MNGILTLRRRNDNSRQSPKSLRGRYALLAERIFFLSAALMLWNLGRVIFPVEATTAGSTLFLCLAWIVYAFAYCIPLYLGLLLTSIVLGIRAPRGDGLKNFPVRTVIFAVVAVLGMFLTQTLIYADSWVYAIFRFHLNGFVLNLLLTPGGFESMDISTSGSLGFAMRLLVILLIQIAVVAFAIFLPWLSRAHLRLLGGGKSRLVFVATVTVLVATQAVWYSFARAAWYRPVLQAASRVPFYIPLTFNHLAQSLGWGSSGPALPTAATDSALDCPKHPLRFGKDSPRYNVMILMCESLRADMLTPEIMPQTFEFAARCLRAKQHYSSGNGTRQGVFGAMTGLHGTYWESMLIEGRGSSAMRLLQNSGYDIELYTSQSFSYPEFDRTIFADISPARMHTRSGGKPSWQRDRTNVTDMTRWLDSRDKTEPFMTFMFFESSHARYAFPPESVIRPDYSKNLNYASDLLAPTPTQARRVFNRYINSAHHLDSQLGRLVKYLETSGQLANTIVVITGDHGEAFFEKGMWGHGGTSFFEEQVRVPLVMYLPGVEPRTIDSLTGHVDIMPTILTRLGLTNPPEDYSVGRDLLKPPPTLSYAVSCGWDSTALITDHKKYVFPYRGFLLPEAFTQDDQPLNEKDVRRDVQPQLLDLMNGMRQFLKR